MLPYSLLKRIKEFVGRDVKTSHHISFLNAIQKLFPNDETPLKISKYVGGYRGYHLTLNTVYLCGTPIKRKKLTHFWRNIYSGRYL